MSDQPPVRADYLTRFQPGKSGHPGGRKPGALKLAAMLAKETRDGREIVEFVLGVLRGKTVEEPAKVDENGKVVTPEKIKRWSDKSRHWAADWASDRLWGKAKQVIELDGGPSAPVANYDALSDEDLANLERIMTKAVSSAAQKPPAALGITGEVIPVDESDQG